MTSTLNATLSASGAPRLQRSWDIRAACNFICGGSGTGLLLAAAVACQQGWPYFAAGVLAIILIVFGLSAVWLEIGRPLRAMNVFFHPQTSWMTREAYLALPVLGLAALAVLLDQHFISLPFQSHGAVIMVVSLAALLGLAFLYCQARILHASKGVPAWSEPALQPVIVVTGIAEGLGLLFPFIHAVAPLPTWMLGAGIVAAAARAAVWERYLRRVALTGPSQSVAVLSQASRWVHVFGHLLPAVLLLSALTMALPIAGVVAGLLLFAAGGWLKFVVVVRAAFTSGFSIPFLPVRGKTSRSFRSI